MSPSAFIGGDLCDRVADLCETSEPTGLPRLKAPGPVAQGTVRPDRVAVLLPPHKEHRWT